MAFVLRCLTVSATLLAASAIASAPGATPSAVETPHPASTAAVQPETTPSSVEATSTEADPPTSETTKDLWMIGLFPLRGSWPGGLGQLPAVQIGLEDVNANPNILSGYRLRMTMDDTAVSVKL